MSLRRLLSSRGTLVRRTDGPPGDYNMPTTVETRTTVAVAVQPISGTEDTYQRTNASATARGFLGPEVAVDVTDRLIVDGATYEIVAPPARVPNHRTGRVHHIELELADLQGA